MRRRFVLLAAACAAAAAVAVPAAMTAVGVDSQALRDAVTVAGIREHQEELQEIANANGGTRHSGSSGYDESADYVVETLVAAGYTVSRKPFSFPFFQETAPPVFEQTAPNVTVYVEGTDFFTMEYSGSGGVTAEVQAVDLVLPPTPTPSSTSGCETADFAGFTAGNVALIQRGTCTFEAKAVNAEAAGASAVIIFNEGQEGRTDAFAGTLGGPVVTIPVIGTSFAVGNDLAATAEATVHIQTTTTSETRQTENVIAETPGGRADRVVVVGAHLDSVPEGPGINDNGSGSGTILEIAEQIADLDIAPRNKIRFMWYGAEESGLLGSEFYVDGLSKQQIKDIAVMLNFDMVGSPNYARFVYDGDGSGTGTAGPNGSDVVEDVFNDYFAGAGLSTEPTAFDGRSDYGPFIAVGIPAGGLFTGAEGINPANGIAYDPYYHQACDDFDNVNLLALDEMSDAAAHAVLTFAMTTSSVHGTDQGNGNGTQSEAEFRGSHAQR